MSPSRAASRAVHDLLGDLQKRNRFVGDVQGLAMSPLESQLLVELSGVENATAKSLGETLLVEKSVVSKALSGLVERGMVRERPADHDRRAKLLSLTQKGLDLTADLDRRANALLEEFAAPLDPTEAKSLGEFFSRLADGAGVPPAARRKADHPLRPQMRRLARFVGRMGKARDATKLTSLQWFLMVELERSSDPVRQSALGARLGALPNTLSAAVQNLVTRKLVRRSEASDAGRGVTHSLTEKGLETLEAGRSEATAEIEEALSSFTGEELATFVGLLRRFAIPPESTALDSDTFEIQPRLETRVMTSEDDLLDARRFLLDTIGSDERNLPENLAASSHLNIVLLRNGAVSGLLELKDELIVNFGLKRDLSVEDARLLTAGAFRHAWARSGVASYKAPHDAYFSASIRRALPAIPDAGPIEISPITLSAPPPRNRTRADGS